MITSFTTNDRDANYLVTQRSNGYVPELVYRRESYEVDRPRLTYRAAVKAVQAHARAVGLRVYLGEEGDV